MRPSRARRWGDGGKKKREPRPRPPSYRLQLTRLTACPTAAVAVFAANPADIRHVTAIPAHGQTAFTGNLALLFRAHRGKASPALFRPASGRGSSGATPGGLAPLLRGATGLSPASAVAACSLRAGATPGLVLPCVLCGHARPAAACAPAGRALTIGFLGLNALPVVGVGVDLSSSALGPGFRDSESLLIDFASE